MTENMHKSLGDNLYRKRNDTEERTIQTRYRIIQVMHCLQKPSEIRIWDLASSMGCRRLPAAFSQQRTVRGVFISLLIKKGLLLGVDFGH